MTYSINTVQLSELTNHVITVDWSFTTDDGFLRSTHVLHTPPGDLTPDEVTEAVLIDWLKQQLPETEEQMVASIKAEKERREQTAAVVAVTLSEGESLQQAVESYHQWLKSQECEAKRHLEKQMAIEPEPEAAA